MQAVRSSIPGGSRSVSTQRRGDARCLLSRLRRFRRRPNRGPIPPVANKKQRGVIVKMLDRFAEARVKRPLKEEKGVIARNPQTRRPSE